MALIRFDFSMLRQTKPSQYLSRFLFGAVVTLFAGLVSKWAGPIVGGLFLAFPGIFPPGISLVETQETERKRKEGLHGTERARALAGLHAAGASEGTVGLIAFAAILWFALPRYGLLRSLLVATLAWFPLAFGTWWLREKL